MNSTGFKNIIRIRDCVLHVSLNPGLPTKPGQTIVQPVSLSVDVAHDAPSADTSDNPSRSINRSSIYQLLQSVLTDVSYPSIEDALHAVLAKIHEVLESRAILQVIVKIVQPELDPLHCKHVGLEAWSVVENGTWEISRTRHFVTDFVRPTIGGVDPVEREEGHNVVVNISVDSPVVPLKYVKLDFRKLIRALWKGMGQTSYSTLEALANYVAKETLTSLAQEFALDVEPLVTVSVAEPNASEVEIIRVYDDFKIAPASMLSKVVIAFGSNLEDRFHNIEYALRLLEDPSSLLPDVGRQPRVSVIDTSFLYETAPMYVTDQPAFINGACLVETNLQPVQLLQLLKAIESAVGRTPTFRNGPRMVDLDIIFYDDLILDTRAPSQRSSLDNLIGELVIPHPRVQEREFALRPIADMMPDYVHPVLRSSVEELLENLQPAPDEPPMCKVIPFPDHSTYNLAEAIKPPATLTYWLHPSHPPHSSPGSRPATKTRLMATLRLNVTPDSFSDGSEYATLPFASTYAKESVQFGAGMIDINGYSTYPGAAPVRTDEEIKCIIPVVQALRSIPEGDGCSRVPLSVDTFRWEVAEATLETGFNVINDFYGFAGPCEKRENDEKAIENMDKMKAIARKYSTPVILVHSRADAGRDYSAYTYTEKTGTPAVVEGVRVELGAKVERIIKGKGGVRRWLVIADPGIGFSKTIEDDRKLLKYGAQVVDNFKIGREGERRRNSLSGLPTLVDTTQNSFVDSLAKDGWGHQTTTKERVWATAVAVTCAIQQNALIVRVDDVKEMAGVVAMADALWR